EVSSHTSLVVPTGRMQHNCLSAGEISNQLSKLSSADSNAEQASVVNRLLEDGRKSSICRKQLISSLISAMDKPNRDLSTDRAEFYVWHYGAEILAKLRATESLDFLIAHLDVYDGVDFPMNHHPAMVAVVRMGNLAVPKLNKALSNTRDPRLRRHVVFCIGWLGGPTARKVLAQALAVENDTCTRSFITATLEALSNKQKPNQITSSDRLRWYGSFQCNGQSGL
ncbi:MAG TPA: HEAT repeat domain-containing protein, partial [Pyrinomonadaceae bacterium]|nr:HEAT repeat domain-containing protein [Pyrinomonadaceae bacterium]